MPPDLGLRMDAIRRALGGVGARFLCRRTGHATAAPLWALPVHSGRRHIHADGAQLVRATRGLKPALRREGPPLRAVDRRLRERSSATADPEAAGLARHGA